MKAGVIVNPQAGGGRAARQWLRLERALANAFPERRISFTAAPGDAPALLRAHLDAGARLIVAVGGDGTAGEVADALLRLPAGERDGVELAILPAGRGCDLARGLGIRGGPDELVAAIAAAPARPFDAGRIFIGQADHGRHFLNVASLGISADIAAAANVDPLRLPARWLFLWHTLRALARYRPWPLKLKLDGVEMFEGDAALVAVANAPFFGGGIPVMPDARPDDGAFDVLVARGAGRLALVRALSRLHAGAHLGLGICTHARGRIVEIEPAGPRAPGLEADGEAFAFAPCRIELVPRALRLRWPDSASQA